MELKVITNYIEKLFPLEFAEDFDNIGLLIGRSEKEISKILICLDCDKNIVDEAIEEKAELIITHHPVIFDGAKRICDDTDFGKMVIKALENNISIYSAHTNADSAKGGLTDEICSMLDLKPVSAILGNVGRICRAPKGMTAKELCKKIKDAFNLPHLFSTFSSDREISSVAVVNGSGGSLSEAAKALGADVFISGDIKHHQLTELKINDDFDFIEIRHYDCEIPFCSLMKEKLQKKFKGAVEIKISKFQSSPLIDTDLIL